MNNRKVKIAIFCLLILFTGWLLTRTTKIAYAKAKYNSVCELELNGDNKSTQFQYDSAYSSTTDFHSKFPYSKILKENNIYDYNSINMLIVSMNKYDSVEINNQQQVASLIGDSLPINYLKNVVSYNYDSLMVLYKFAQKMKYYGECSPQYSTMYSVIYSGLMLKISDKMGVFLENNPDLKFDEKFIFLNDLLHCDKYGCIVSKSSIEKIIDNITQSKWDYLFSKFIYDSNGLTKLGVFLFFILQLFLIFTTIRYFKIKTK